MSSLTNQIIANIKRASTQFNSSSFINSENVVCIDTSNTRIGINTKSPRYSIDISGTDISDAISVNNLYVTNLAKLEEISCNKIEIKDFSGDIIDVSEIIFKTISGDRIDASFLKVKDIDINKLYIADFCCNSIRSDTTISGDIIQCNEIITNNFTSTQANFTALDLPYIIISISGDIKTLYNEDLSSNYIKAHEISTNLLYVKNKAFFLSEASLNNLYVVNDSSFNKINVTGHSQLTDVSCGNVSVTNEISANSMNVTTITSGGRTIITDGTLGDSTTPSDAIFNNIVAKKLDISDVIITRYLDNSGLTDLSDGQLILPENNNVTDISGSIKFDRVNNILQVYNNSEWNNILFNINYATLKLNNEISGNNISYNINSNSYFIDESNNLRLDESNYKNYKYIPLKYDVSFGTKFDLSNNYKTIEILNNKSSDLYEINANVGMRFLNRDPSDVEPNNYRFGIYPHVSSGQLNKDSIDNSYAEIMNSILVFDNSFNYANSSLSYIGPLQRNNSTNRYGFNFYISAYKDLNYLVIDSFNCTIKLVK